MRLIILHAALIAALATACRSAEDRALAEFKTRLKASDRLSEADRARFVVEIVRAIGGRKIREREPGGERELNPDARAEVLSVLTGGLSIDDAGVKVDGTKTLRGLSGPGTPARSEIDAERTLWTDIDTLLPIRYELKYSLAGYGDYAYDLAFDR